MDENNLDTQLEACIESSNRARYLIFSLILVSIFSFTQYWNHRGNTWFNAYTRYAKISFTFFSIRQILIDEKIKNREKLDFSTINEEVKKIFEIHKPDEAKALKEILYFWNKKEINYDIKELNKIKSEQFFKQYLLENEQINRKQEVSFPAVYISFHSNDLSLFSGLGLSALLILICYSFNRELKNIDIVFYNAREKKKLRDTYILLSMKQMFTVPPSLKSRFLNTQVLSLLPKLILLIPIFIQVLICLEDFTSYENMLYLEPKLIITQLALGLSLTITVIIFSIWCLLIVLDIDSIWRHAAYEIMENKNSV